MERAAMEALAAGVLACNHYEYFTIEEPAQEEIPLAYDDPAYAGYRVRWTRITTHRGFGDNRGVLYSVEREGGRSEVTVYVTSMPPAGPRGSRKALADGIKHLGVTGVMTVEMIAKPL